MPFLLACTGKGPRLAGKCCIRVPLACAAKGLRWTGECSIDTGDCSNNNNHIMVLITDCNGLFDGHKDGHNRGHDKCHYSQHHYECHDMTVDITSTVTRVNAALPNPTQTFRCARQWNSNAALSGPMWTFPCARQQKRHGAPAWEALSAKRSQK